MAAILRLDTRDDGIAAALWQLFQDAYAIEAALLDVTDFPPLRRTVADIQGSHTEFHGILAGGELVAVAELAREPDFCIDALVVAPTQFRRGLASHLLVHLLALTAPQPLVVDTGANNEPALALYRRHGFVETRRWVNREGIAMVSLTSVRLAASC